MLMGRGLGDFISEGLANDCLTFGPNICDFFAGKGTYAAALAYRANSIPSPPEPKPLPGPTTIQQETVPGAFTPDQAIAAGYAANQQQYQDFFGQVADVAASNTPSTPGIQAVPTWVWIAGGIAAAVLLKGVLR